MAFNHACGSAPQRRHTVLIYTSISVLRSISSSSISFLTSSKPAAFLLGAFSIAR